MQRDDFYYLFVNANCIAELAIDASELAKILADDAATPADSDATVDPMIPDSLDELDMDALDGMAFFGDDSVPEITEDAAPQPDVPAAPAEGSNAFDINVYMQNAYAMAPELGERIDRAFARADHSKIDALMARLPPPSASIVTQLSGDDLQPLLDLYKADDGDLSELVIQIRQSDS